MFSWRHGPGKRSALLMVIAGQSPVTRGCPAERAYDTKLWVGLLVLNWAYFWTSRRIAYDMRCPYAYVESSWYDQLAYNTYNDYSEMELFGYFLGPLLLIWFNFNPGMDK